MTQPDLLTAPPVADTRAPEADRPRLTKQCLAILERLQHGPASRSELTAIALNATARISDLRRCGFNVQMVERHESGLTIYALVKGEQ